MSAKRACRSKTVLVLPPNRIVVLRMLCGHVIGPNACKYCREKRQRQVLEEVTSHSGEGLFLRICDPKEARLALVRLRRAERAWRRRLPQPDGTVAIIATNNQKLRGNPMPSDEADLEEMVRRLLDTPPGSRISQPRGSKHVTSRREEAKSFIANCQPGLAKACAEEAGAIPKWYSHDKALFKAEPGVQEAFLAGLEGRGIRVSERNKPRK